MAYSILKHRRGTTQEWFDINLIPQEGELVIEECIDGTLRCKIGNGHSNFLDLDYIDDNTKRLLLNKLAESEASLRKSLTDLDSQHTNALKTNYAIIKETIQTTVEDLQAAFRSYTDDEVAELSKSIDKKITDVDSNLSSSIILTKNELANKIKLLENSVDETKKDIKSYSDEQDVLLETRLSEELSSAISTLDEKFTNIIKDSSLLTDKELKRLSNELITLKTELEVNTAEALQKTKEELNNSIKVITKSHHSDIDALDKKLDSEITKQAEELASQVKKTEEALLLTEETITSAYTNDISDLKQLLQKALLELSDEKTNEIDSAKTLITSLLEVQKTKHLEDVASLESTIIDLAKVSNEKLISHEELNMETFKNLEKLISDLQEKTESLSSDDLLIIEQLYQITNKLNTELDEIAANLTNTINKHTVDVERLSAENSSLRESTVDADLKITNTLSAYIEDIYSELETLVANDLNIVKSQNARDNMLDLSLTELSFDLRQLIEDTKSELKASIASLASADNLKFAELQDELVRVESLIDDKKGDLLNKFEEVSETTGALRTALNSEVNTINNRLNSLDTRVDDNELAIKLQSNRISKILSLEDGSTTGDIELIDIRRGYNGIEYLSAGDAVRAVGEDTKKLRDSLSQYIDTQAIDGLHYDYIGEVGLKQPYMLYLKSGNDIIEDSAVQIISGAGSGGGGSTASSLSLGYITTSPVITTTETDTILRFTFSGTDSSGDTILQATSTWKVNGVSVEYGTIKDGENEFDITKYLSVGTTKVLLVVTDDNGSTVTKSWSIQQIKLSVESDFDDKNIFKANEEEVIFTYFPEGSIEKTAVLKLDGKEIDRTTLDADISGTEVRYRIPPQAHGSHLLELHLEAKVDGIVVPPTKPVIKDLLFYDPASDIPVIGTTTNSLKMKQYSTEKIIFTVYDPNTEIPTVTIKVDGREVSTVSVKPNKDFNNTPTEVYSYSGDTAGTHIIQIICGKTIKNIKVDVEELDIKIPTLNIDPVFDFNPVGRNNNDIANRLWSHNDVHMVVSDNFDWTNGGYIPEDSDGPCFCVKAGSYITIDYKLFSDDAKKYGKEFKLIFKTKNVANPDAVFLSCIDNTTDKDHIGIEMGVHNAYIYGQNGKLELSYSEEDIIEFEFNISKNTEKVPMVMGYEDGVPSRPMVYDNSYNFTQNTPKDIVIGSPDCDIFIYRFKVYNTSLTNTEILNNFIKDARTSEEMISRYRRNQIYNENHKLTPEAFAEKCPWLRVYAVSAPYFTNNKSDKVKDTTIKQFYKNGDPVLDNWVCYNAQHSGQGTSSNNYGAAGRNLDFIMNKSDSYFELGDGTITDKITLTRESVPVAYLNAKVNIASANNLTNAILAKRYNTFNPYKRPFVERDGINLDFIKDTMEFHNCVIFIRETDPTISTHREFADTDWHFYAIGNIGDSKKTDNTRATDPNDEYECCVEIMDVGLPLSDFPVDTMINAMGYNTDTTTGEVEYIWAKTENLDKLYELEGEFVLTQDTDVIRNKAYYSYNPITNTHKCIAYPSKSDLPRLYELHGKYVLTTDTEINLNKTYYIDILENDDFSEDFTYGWRYIYDDENAEIVKACKQRWIDFYRFVTTSTDEVFKRDFDSYFAKDSALFYYLFTARYCMVDNRAKNTFWHYGKTADGTYKWDLCWDYDNDTALGLNNYGKQVYRYGLEDIDKDSSGVEVFRESDSTFFCRVRDLFSKELKIMYNDLESKNAWHAESFLSECDAWQNEFPEELWRLDIERKYIRTYTSSFINGAGDHQFLDNMCNGRMKYHRRQWERNQEQYMASKYQTPTAMNEMHHANFRVNRFNSTEGFTVLPNYSFTITPYSHIYVNVQYGETAPISKRANPNEPVFIEAPASLSADIINVGSASTIRDFGDLSRLYLNTVSVQNADRIKILNLGNDTEGYNNAAFTSNLSNDDKDDKPTTNPLLEVLNIENISSITKPLSLTDYINLKKLFASGTNIPSVTFAAGSKIQEVELPAVNDITLKQLKYLSTDNFKLSSYDNVVDLVIEDCPLINQVEVLNKCTKLRRARLINIDFGNVTYDYFTSKIFGLNGLNAAGEETPYAVLSGTARFDKLTGSQFDELSTRYPQLEITYDLLESLIEFKDTDLSTTVHQDIVINAADYRNPVYYEEVDNPEDLPEGMIAKPVKNSTEVFDYVFLGWSTSSNIIVSVEDTDNILTDEIRRAFKEDAVKKVEGNRTLYPVFEAVRHLYKVSFVNPTDNNKELYSVMVPHGKNAEYKGEIAVEALIKCDTSSPEDFVFSSWYPGTENITGPRVCYAQFAVDKDSWHELALEDISNCEDKNGNLYDGYTLNTYNSTMSITKNKNNLNTAVLVKDTLEVPEYGTFTITNLGGFRSNKNLTVIDLPDSLLVISDDAFNGCKNLEEVYMPDSLTSIGKNAFRSCAKLDSIKITKNIKSIGKEAFTLSGLKTIEIDPLNTKYLVIDNCLVDTQNKILLHGGLPQATIPQNGSISSLAEYCFHSTDIISAHIPEGISSVPGNAFSRCYSLNEVILPSTIKKLDATCFGFCEDLTKITLPEGLTDINTWVFYDCAFENVVIPASVTSLLDRSFGNIETLKTVTFKKKLDAKGNIVIPRISETAFVGSGSEEGLVINIPWQIEDTPAAPWGAINCTINHYENEEDLENNV